MSEQTADEINLMDLLVVIAENWLLLLLMPLAVGAITYGALAIQPQTYVSETVVAIPPAEVAKFIETGLAEDTLDAKLILARPNGEGVTIAPNENALGTRIALIAGDRNVGEVLRQLTELMKTAVRAGTLTTELHYLDRRIENLQAAMDVRNGAIARLGDILAQPIRQPEEVQTYALSALAFNQLVLSRAADEAELIVLKDQFATSNAEIVVSSPTSPGAQGRSSALIAVLAIFGSAVILLVIIFIKAGLNSVASKEANRDRLDRIKNGLFLRRPK